ncbi:type I restriction enzyme HsdR N-terminal domain-containing protein [Bacteroides caecigallinarum]|uniref:type I restriction enzyme HsdR N-terminal domain-containing protein n=1 Tax=Bacteroides caecigallinarum TaxID=1411144 RepID=UPI001F2692D6|nr:type I restriction enzyme HsdR N-terminal domain-containing protein [Bacteroides caecigallinarum]MCF2552625.1 type I restriction enzyme HsdR N-terminal domain-containing protein [Bacteroides caecigallinarum]
MDIQDIKRIIHTLVEKYEANRDFYRTSKFNETQVRNEFLDPLFESLGWDIRNISGKSTNEREVLLEESLKADAVTHSKKPDYTFRLFGERKFFLEAKKPCVDISTDDNPAKQVRRYGYTANLKISVLSNFEDLYIYDTSYKVEDGDTLTKARIKAYHYTDYENAADELLQLLGKESVYTGHFEEVWNNIELNVVHQSVDSLFLDQINQWRLMLGKQILSYDSNLDTDYLGDIVQSYINKILFLRVCEDRNIETYQRLLTIANHNSHKELVAKFKDADNKYNSGLFEELISEEVIGNISSSFWTIIRQLYFPESPYSFTVLSSDILGRIYEIFIAERLAIVDGELKIVKKPENMERDIVTTPNFVVREILRQTAVEIIKNKTANEINNLKCADIACGSGAFLLELYQVLHDSLVDYYIENDCSKLIQTSIGTYKLPYEMKRNLLVNCIYGVDKDFNAVEACKFGLLLKLLEDEDVNSLSSFHPILPDLANNIFYGNSLLSTVDIPSNDIFEIKEKMIVGVLAQSDKYSIDNNGTLVSSGGTAGYCLVSVPSDSMYSIYYIQAILGSVQGEWLASLYGEIFRGGYIARGTKVLKQIPIREIDFTNQNERNTHDDIVNRQKKLIELGDKINKAAKKRRILIPLQRQFDLLKEEQQKVINMLYGMTDDEVSLIPKIKELYAAD